MELAWERKAGQSRSIHTAISWALDKDSLTLHELVLLMTKFGICDWMCTRIHE